jgi:hypothetical protein
MGFFRRGSVDAALRAVLTARGNQTRFALHTPKRLQFCRTPSPLTRHLIAKFGALLRKFLKNNVATVANLVY